jgi:hypothetical protein
MVVRLTMFTPGTLKQNLRPSQYLIPRAARWPRETDSWPSFSLDEPSGFRCPEALPSRNPAATRSPVFCQQIRGSVRDARSHVGPCSVSL